MLTIKLLPGKLREAVEILRSLSQPLKVKHDCLNSAVYESEDDENRILYIEQWKTKEAFHRHIQSDLYRRVLAVMELAESTPLVQFHEFTNLQGMDLIVALRQGNESKGA